MLKNWRQSLFTPWTLWLAFLGTLLAGGLVAGILVF